MTAAFGRRNLSPSLANKPAPAAKLAPAPVLTPAQRAYLFAGEETGAPDKPAAAATRPPRGAGLIACAAVTAVTVALGSIGKHDVALTGLPPAVEPMSQDFLALIGSGAGPFALAWTSLITFVNFSANLLIARKLASALALSAPPAYAALGAGLGLAMAWGAQALGLGASDIGLAMEALAGGAVAALYRLLCGPARA